MVSWWVGRFQIGNFQPLCLKFPVENARPRAVQSHESARREATRRVSLREAAVNPPVPFADALRCLSPGKNAHTETPHPAKFVPIPRKRKMGVRLTCLVVLPLYFKFQLGSILV